MRKCTGLQLLLGGLKRGMANPSTPLGELVRGALGDRTQLDLATAIGLNPSFVARMLTRPGYSARAAGLRAMAAELGLPASKVLRAMAANLPGDEAVLAGHLLLIAAELRVDVGELLPGPAGEDLEPGHLLERAR